MLPRLMLTSVSANVAILAEESSLSSAKTADGNGHGHHLHRLLHWHWHRHRIRHPVADLRDVRSATQFRLFSMFDDE